MLLHIYSLGKTIRGYFENLFYHVELKKLEYYGLFCYSQNNVKLEHITFSNAINENELVIKI